MCPENVTRERDAFDDLAWAMETNLDMGKIWKMLDLG
jgi:hypothetical protein